MFIENIEKYETSFKKSFIPFDKYEIPNDSYYLELESLFTSKSIYELVKQQINHLIAKIDKSTSLCLKKRWSLGLCTRNRLLRMTISIMRSSIVVK